MRRRLERWILTRLVEFGALVVTQSEVPAATIRTVTISLEPIRWHGSPVVTWLAAGVAWSWAGVLALVYAVGAA